MHKELPIKFIRFTFFPRPANGLVSTPRYTTSLKTPESHCSSPTCMWPDPSESVLLKSWRSVETTATTYVTETPT